MKYRASNKVSECYPEAIHFESLSVEEIRKLSVVEVRNVQSFDILGHPAIGGVYDPALGPNDRDELCETCNDNYFNCPGHFGHIELPVLVFNPVFYTTMYRLLGGSCFRCHRLTTTEANIVLTKAQLELVNKGLVTEAKDLQAMFEHAAQTVNMAETLTIQSKVKEYLDAINARDVEEPVLDHHVRNTIDLRSEIVNKFVRSCGVRTCPHCKSHKCRLLNVNKTRILIEPGRSKKPISMAQKQRKKKNDENEGDDDDDVREDVLNQRVWEKQLSQLTILTPMEAQKHLELMWEKDAEVLRKVYKILDNDHSKPIDIFFIQVVPVIPSKFRPVNVVSGKQFENPQSSMLSKIVQSCHILRHLVTMMKAENETEVSTDVRNIMDRVPGASLEEKFPNAWSNLQLQVNLLLSSDDKLMNDNPGLGVKQLIEKKTGLFRSGMMGKRVNYAARSVISPDPLIGIDEIGIPEVFAKKLTYPQPVTEWNIQEIRQRVANGPENYPGAVLVHNEHGSMTLLLSKNETQRKAMAKTLLTPSLGEGMKGAKVVHRHVINGDVVLVNRQPTLHRPSIMAHKVRVLPDAKTLRLHYSNCKTYNADFDGDEMNIHFPQNEMARAEAELLANVTNQYLVPKDGTPLGGLIQDHIVAGLHMTIRGRFFSRHDYQQLVSAALTDKVGSIQTLPPAIIKPQQFWSGKQVFSTVLMNLIPEDKSLINLNGKSKIAAKNWENGKKRPWKAGGSYLTELNMTESEVIIRQGELLCGVLDKAHYGPTPYGMIHCCYELYGGTVSSRILTALGRLFTYFLQILGFTLGVEDILVETHADRKRKELMEISQKGGLKVAYDAFGEGADDEDDNTIFGRLEAAHRNRDELPMRTLDMHMKKHTDGANNAINSILMPKGLLKQFPHNNLQVMVQSGAKGTSVNNMQISSLLGQIELEGKRPPLMLSGRTLPSFLAYDTSPRAGGFVDGRFLTGIKSQEYFFHCMAGREGLIDTAVKTSRSGYLQRCLVKHLEGLKVHYDNTVRDSDGSVIQYLYGEDGLDIPKTPFLNPNALPFLAQNISAAYNPSLDKADDDASRHIRKQKKKIKKWKQLHHSPIERDSPYLRFCRENPKLDSTQLKDLWINLDKKDKKRYTKLVSKCPEPVVATYRPDLHLGSIAERLDDLIEKYVSEHGDTDDSHIVGETPSFKLMMEQKIRQSLCQAGEAVGLLAAQSIGEPSTQMTLNTFHFAGRGEMNVTLGIPRLAEILKTASAKIKTPSMELPFRAGVDKKVAESLKLKLTKVHLNQVLEGMNVNESLAVNHGVTTRLYTIRFTLLPHAHYRDRFCTTNARVLQFIENKFLKQLQSALKRKFKLLAEHKLVTHKSTRFEKKISNKNDDDEDGGDATRNDKTGRDSDSEGEHGEDAEARYKSRDDGEEDEEADGGDANEEEDGEWLDEDETNQENGHDDHDEDEDSKTEPCDRYEAMEENGSQSKKQKKKERIENVLHNLTLVHDYDYDAKHSKWCEVTFKLAAKNSKVGLMSLLDEAIKCAVVHEVKKINRAFVTESGNTRYLKTDGVNIRAMFKYGDILDINRLYCNDIHAIANMYGIEAATRVIVKEVQAVFRVYGIEIDPRHLLLVADYMTYGGQYRPLDRHGMGVNSSPLQQMSFENTVQFLKNAIVNGFEDNLFSPSAKITLGQPVQLGTGGTDMFVSIS